MNWMPQSNPSTYIGQKKNNNYFENKKESNKWTEIKYVNEYLNSTMKRGVKKFFLTVNTALEAKMCYQFCFGHSDQCEIVHLLRTVLPLDLTYLWISSKLSNLIVWEIYLSIVRGMPFMKLRISCDIRTRLIQKA